MEQLDLKYLNIINTKHIFRNACPAVLVTEALERKEGELSSTGALCVNTGKYNGRSPNDRFIVDTPNVHEHINWGKVNIPIDEASFDNLYSKLTSYFQGKDLFVFDGFCGADKDYRVPIRVINDLASQSLASSSLFKKATDEELKTFKPEFTIICSPDFHAIPQTDNTNSEVFILMHLDRNMVIIGGSSYVGEIKKSMFSAMNFMLPFKNVFPMHCSANTDDSGNTALFFGLSGTGKTTLSADPERMLIGDDEHGWSENGIFNFEGGCYAKTINLKRENEPQIFDAIKFGTLLENVVNDPETGVSDYSDDKYTQNTRAAYPITYIPNAVLHGTGNHPKTVVFLTADAFGVLPPISKLTPEQAMKQFVLGYTSKLAGTERGIIEPQTTFSCCFGAPFMLLHPQKYAQMLRDKINKYNADVYLINTGWTGGQYGKGERISLKYTRRMVKAAVNGEFKNAEFKKDKFFGFNVPVSCPDVPSEILDTVRTWANADDYAKTAQKLAAQFEEKIKEINFTL